ncbi:MAG: phage holin family protein [Akkermansiaceae bacterium]
MANDTELAQNTETSTGAKGPVNWKEAGVDFISSKVGIFRVEAKAAATAAIGKIALLLVAVFFLFVTYALLLVGLVGWISDSINWQWYHVAFAISGGHCLISLILLLMCRSKPAEPFPMTRAELEKDREWLETLKTR